MIKTFVVLYSVLIYTGGTDYEEAVSHGLTFESYIQCEDFFYKNKKHLLAGAVDYGERRYGFWLGDCCGFYRARFGLNLCYYHAGFCFGTRKYFSIRLHLD